MCWSKVCRQLVSVYTTPPLFTLISAQFFTAKFAAEGFGFLFLMQADNSKNFYHGCALAFKHYGFVI